MSDLISRKALCEYALNQKDKSITPNDIMRFPSAQSTMGQVFDEDTINRQAAIDAVGSMLRRKFGIGGDLAEITLAGLPSAQADSKELSGTHKALDTVSRQAVIEAINKIFPADPMRDDYTQGITCGAALANIYVAQLPSAHPEKRTEERTETHACDLISRQAAIDAVYKCADIFAGDMPVMVVKSDAYEALAQLPSAQPEVLACGEGELIAQPEIIRCNDCKHWTQTTGNMCGFGLGDCDYINAKLVNCNGFCSWAERRTDG